MKEGISPEAARGRLDSILGDPSRDITVGAPSETWRGIGESLIGVDLSTLPPIPNKRYSIQIPDFLKDV